MKPLLNIQPCNVLFIVSVVVITIVTILYQVLRGHGGHAAVHGLGGVQQGHDVTDVTSLLFDDSFAGLAAKCQCKGPSPMSCMIIKFFPQDV